jgi:hypothetical protein
MWSHREALGLMWDKINFVSDSIRVQESKTRAGIRNVPPVSPVQSRTLELAQNRRSRVSPFVFPNMRHPARPLNDIRHAWAKVLKDAGLHYFWIYNLRHTFAGRLSAAGVADLFVAQMIGYFRRAFCKLTPRPLTSIDAMRSANLRRCGLHTLPGGMLTLHPLTEVRIFVLNSVLLPEQITAGSLQSGIFNRRQP